MSASAQQPASVLGATLASAPAHAPRRNHFASRLRRADSVVPAMIVLSIAIFAIDVMMPKGVGISTLYLVIVLLGLLTRSGRVVVFGAFTTSLLIAAGWFLSNPGAEPIYTIPQRIIAAAVCWVIAVIGMRRLSFEREVTWLRDSHAALSREADLRVRNWSDLVATFARFTPDGAGAAEATTARAAALLAVHNQIARSGWSDQPFDAVFRAVVPPDLAARAVISGRCGSISPRHAASLGIVIHELTRDMLGAPKSEGGASAPWAWIQLRQIPSSDSTDRAEIEIHWRQAPVNGSPAPVPAHALDLIQEIVCRDLRGRFTHRAGDFGVEYHLAAILNDRPAEPLPIDHDIHA